MFYEKKVMFCEKKVMFYDKIIYIWLKRKQGVDRLHYYFFENKYALSVSFEIIHSSLTLAMNFEIMLFFLVTICSIECFSNKYHYKKNFIKKQFLFIK